MAQMKIEITRLMDLNGSVTYSLYIDDVLNKEGPDLSEIESLAETLKDGFKRGEFTVKTIYSKTVNYP